MKYSLVLLLLLAVVVPATAQNPKQIYIVARNTGGNPDLGAEKKLRDELSKQKQFKVVSGVSNADLVLLVLTEYETSQDTVGILSGGNGHLTGTSETYLKTVLGVAVLPKTWNEHKDNLETLREQSVWQDSNATATLTRASFSKLVTSFSLSVH